MCRLRLRLSLIHISTLVVPAGWTIHVDGYGNLKIRDEER